MLSSPAPLLGDLFSENIGKREVLAAEDLLDFSQCRRLLAVFQPCRHFIPYVDDLPYTERQIKNYIQAKGIERVGVIRFSKSAICREIVPVDRGSMAQRTAASQTRRATPRALCLAFRFSL
jgi:hypothetical protein